MFRFNDWFIQLYKKVTKPSHLFGCARQLRNVYLKSASFFHQRFISSKKLPNQNTVVYKYSCTIEFAYVYQINTSLAKTGIFQSLLKQTFTSLCCWLYLPNSLTPPLEKLTPPSKSKFFWASLTGSFLAFLIIRCKLCESKQCFSEQYLYDRYQK